MSSLHHSIERFLNTLAPDAGILLAVSGGVDSMVLSQLIIEGNLKRLNPRPLGIAHCNFHLRNEQSNGDEQLVKAFAEQSNVPFFVEHYDTTAYAQAQHLSIQMAARELRYDFFERLCQEHGFHYIAIAHHQDDQIETFFINLFRGTGLKGLQAMSAIRQRVIRPLLEIPREQVLQYALQYQVPFREDESNASDKYLRNRIRHHLLPLLDELDSNARKGILNTIANLQSLDQHRPETIEKWQSMGFSSDSIRKILNTDRQNAQFLSKDYQAIYNRGSWDISPRNSGESLPTFQIHFQEQLQVLELPNHQRLEYQILDHLPDLSQTDAMVFYWDADLLPADLLVRPWREGDRFQPFGLHGRHRRVGRLLIDQKISPIDKEKVYVIEGSGVIYGVVGLRAAEPARTGPFTQRWAVAVLGGGKG